MTADEINQQLELELDSAYMAAAERYIALFRAELAPFNLSRHKCCVRATELRVGAGRWWEIYMNTDIPVLGALMRIGIAIDHMPEGLCRHLDDAVLNKEHL